MRPTGCCTWIFGGEDLAISAARAARAGLDGVELHGDLTHDPVAAGRVLKDHGLAVFSITPGDADISHPDHAIRQAGLNYYDRLIDWAMLPRQWMDFAMTRDLLDVIPVRERLPAPAIVLVRRPDLPLSPPAEFFCDVLLRSLPKA